jgi:hypothetical protein
MSTRLVVLPNIISLPPKCPELDPVENVWQFVRDHWLSNRVFKSCDDLVDHCCEAWNKPTDQPWRIMSIGLRQRAHGFEIAEVAVRHAHFCEGRPWFCELSHRTIRMFRAKLTFVLD